MSKRQNGLIYITILTLSFLSVSPALESSMVDDTEKLIVGETKILYTSSPSRVAIADPQVADVTEVTSSEIVLNAKSPGVTKLVFQDSFGDHSLEVKVVAEDMQRVKERVDNLLVKLNLPEVYTKAEDQEGKVFILGDVKDQQDKERMDLALGSLKEKTVDLTLIKEEEAVVSIDVQVLELDKDATETLGITNPLSTTSGISITEVGSPALTGARWGNFFRMPQAMRPTAFSWTLYALIQEGKARVLSRPRLACQSGKEAELLVGGEKPIFTTDVASAGGQGTEVDYKEYGIKLRIKPVVTEDNRIKLGLNVEVSEVGTAEYIGPTANRTAQAYPLTKRTAATELNLNNGQTMAIGGLIKQKIEEDVTRTPWLSDIPIFGALFKKKVSKIGSGAGERGDVELFITLTPTIVNRPERDTRVKQELKLAETSAVNTIPQAIRGYAVAIQRHVLEHLSYPVSAKQSGFQGTVKLKLHLSYRGDLLDAKIEESSGYNMLDDNAVKVARGISSYPPFPPSIDSRDIWIDIPIVYQLD